MSRQFQPAPRYAVIRYGGSLKTAKGMVKFFNLQKGYGFIAPDDGGKDVFVHISAVERSGLSGLTEDQIVEFETETDERSGKLRVSRLQPA